MNLEFKEKNDFQKFKKEISQRLRNRIKGKSRKAGTIPSAVMIILMNKDNIASVFLTKRTQKVRTHKGQVAFPGGAWESSDKSLYAHEAFDYLTGCSAFTADVNRQVASHVFLPPGIDESCSQAFYPYSMRHPSEQVP